MNAIFFITMTSCKAFRWFYPIYIVLCCIRGIFVLVVGTASLNRDYGENHIEPFQGSKYLHNLYNSWLVLGWIEEYFLENGVSIADIMVIVGSTITIMAICLFALTFLNSSFLRMGIWILLSVQETVFFILTVAVACFSAKDVWNYVLIQKLTTNMSVFIQNNFGCCGIDGRKNLTIVTISNMCNHPQGCLEITSEIILQVIIALVGIEMVLLTFYWIGIVSSCNEFRLQRMRDVKELRKFDGQSESLL